jgi:hypothetical protein
MMEYWNVGRLGLKSGKRSILQIMLCLHFMMMFIRHPFSALTSEITTLSRDNPCIIFALIIDFHHSTIPAFHHSPPPADERSELSSTPNRRRDENETP